MTTRRTFLRQSATALAAGILIPRSLYASTQNVAPSDRLNVALVGCRSMGWYDLCDIMQYPGTSCVALCDIDSGILSNRAAEEELGQTACPLWRLPTHIGARRCGCHRHWHARPLALQDNRRCLFGRQRRICGEASCQQHRRMRCYGGCRKAIRTRRASRSATTECCPLA